MALDDIRTFFSLPEKADTLRIYDVIHFFTADQYTSSLYDEREDFVESVVDFTGINPDGFAFVADTTGHRYESENGQIKKRELKALWDDFMKTVEEEILPRLRNERPFWPQAKKLIAEALMNVSDKMQGIGKSSTFSGVFLVWVASVEIRTDPVPAVIVVQVGDSASFRFSFDEKRSLFSSNVLSSTARQCEDASIAGNMDGMDISLRPVKSGDFILCLTDGLLDHLSMIRHPQMEEVAGVLNNILGEMMMQIMKDLVSADENSQKIHLKRIFGGIREYSLAVANLKLSEEKIRECELDDVAGVVFVVPFLEISSDLDVCKFFSPKTPLLAPPPRSWGDTFNLMLYGKSF